MSHFQKSKSPASLVQASLEPTAAPPRRRVPIKIIDSSGKVMQTSAAETSIPDSKLLAVASPTTLDVNRPSAPGALEAVSSRSLKSAATSGSTVSPAQVRTSSKPNSFSEAKAARENARPSRVGGGIFRASGESTIFATSDRVNDEAQVASRSPISQQPTKVAVEEHEMVYGAPSTLFDFIKTWSSLSSIEERWRYLNVRFFLSCYSTWP